MKIRFLLNLSLFSVFFQCCLAGLPEDPVEYAKWEVALLDAIGQQSKKAPEIAIPKLGNWVHQLSGEFTSNIEKGNKPVFHAAQQALLAIPGHAEYYDRKIRQTMDVEVANNGNGNDRDRVWSFQTLEHLPSPETVKVLGELLYDVRDPYKDAKGYEDTGTPWPNFKCASMTLTRMGIKKSPVKNTNPLRSGYEDSEVEKWRVWYEQVKAGTRTFSFDGDETIYNLAGRTTVARDGPVQSRPDRKVSNTSDENNAPTTNPVSRVPVVIAFLFLLGIAVFTVKQMKGRVPKSK